MTQRHIVERTPAQGTVVAVPGIQAQVLRSAVDQGAGEARCGVVDAFERTDAPLQRAGVRGEGRQFAHFVGGDQRAAALEEADGAGGPHVVFPVDAAVVHVLGVDDAGGRVVDHQLVVQHRRGAGHLQLKRVTGRQAALFDVEDVGSGVGADHQRPAEASRFGQTFVGMADGVPPDHHAIAVIDDRDGVSGLDRDHAVAEHFKISGLVFVGQGERGLPADNVSAQLVGGFGGNQQGQQRVLARGDVPAVPLGGTVRSAGLASGQDQRNAEDRTQAPAMGSDHVTVSTSAICSMYRVRSTL